MIVVSACAGLANQMFQYAFYLSLKEKGLPVLWDQSNYIPNSAATCEMVRIQDVFPGVCPDLMPEGHFRMAYWKRRWTFLKRLSGPLTGRWYLLERGFSYHDDEASRAKKDCIYIGSWQCEKYFASVGQKVREAFAFPAFTSGRNASVARQMAEQNSVAIHVRKGKDYTRELLFQGTCPDEYYSRAVVYIRERVPSPVFYVFADNPDWVREHFSGFEYTLVDWNPVRGKENYLDMQLMSCAKHNIISNSTYSWWGAWLNPNPDKVVVAPAVWFNPAMPFYNPNEVVPQSWIKL